MDMKQGKGYNEHKKQQGYRTLPIIMIAVLGLSSCLNHLVKVEPITLGNSSGGKTTVYFKDANHDELVLSITDKRSDLWDTNANIAIFYKPIYYKITGDTLHIMCEKPDCLHPELTDAHIVYHFRDGNPLCYEKQARADGYKIIHSLWTIEDYNLSSIGENATDSFRVFFSRFETDCDYQKSHVVLPLVVVKYPDDPDDSRIDTTYMDKWECFDAFSSFDMVIEDVSSDTKRVVFSIDDTGFHVEYYFVLKGDEWYLNRIVDLGM